MALFLGAVVFLVMISFGPGDDGTGGFTREAWVSAALALMMIIWWVSEALPIPVTSLAPLAVLPLFGVLTMREASAPYMSPIVVLLMAGFIVAKGIERWNLHSRIALGIISKVGTKPPALLAGFMVSAALLSMWISNTATSLMMMPIALSVAAVIANEVKSERFRLVLLLSVAYACSIGGLATPVGSPTNLIVIGYLADQGIEVGFSDWMRLGLPVVVVTMPLAWGVLVYFGGRLDASRNAASVSKLVSDRRRALGPISVPEVRTAIVFAFIALGWIFRAQLQLIPGLSTLNDQIIAVLGVLALFSLPSGSQDEPGTALLDWQTAEKIPWSVILLFGGGLSLASAISKSGLAAFMATQFSGLLGIPEIGLIFLLVVMVLMLTEFTSNVATVSALMPMIGAMAIAGGVDPFLLAAPVGLAASCAFMLPMATGPNAVAYAAGGITMGQMAKIGIRINIISAVVITLITTLMTPSINQ